MERKFTNNMILVDNDEDLVVESTPTDLLEDGLKVEQPKVELLVD